jgi:probable rRNA maturation factor
MSFGITYFKQGVRFRLTHQAEVIRWIGMALKNYGYRIEGVSYIFCSDEYLLELNKQYLNHDYFTDIITFNNSSSKKNLEADIFISIDRVKENAEKYKTGFTNELHRVMIHGALHLAGFNDKNTAQQNKMRKAEDLWLGKRKFLQK